MNKTKQLLIDLTPLLDVILILLFLILVNNQNQMTNKIEEQEKAYLAEINQLEEKYTENELQLSDLEKEKGDLEDALNDAESILGLTDSERKAFSEVMDQTSIFLVEIPNSYPESELQLTINQGETVVKPTSMSVETWLENKMDTENTDMFIILLKYSGDRILWRDYSQVKQALEKINGDNLRIFFAEENISK